MPEKKDEKTERLLTNRLHGGSELLRRDFGAKESVHLKTELTLLISNYLFQIIYFKLFIPKNNNLFSLQLYQQSSPSSCCNEIINCKQFLYRSLVFQMFICKYF